MVHGAMVERNFSPTMKISFLATDEHGQTRMIFSWSPGEALHQDWLSLKKPSLKKIKNIAPKY